jgi:hypothetical protein
MTATCAEAATTATAQRSAVLPGAEVARAQHRNGDGVEQGAGGRHRSETDDADPVTTQSRNPARSDRDPLLAGTGSRRWTPCGHRKGVGRPRSAPGGHRKRAAGDTEKIRAQEEDDGLQAGPLAAGDADKIRAGLLAGRRHSGSSIRDGKSRKKLQTRRRPRSTPGGGRCRQGGRPRDGERRRDGQRADRRAGRDGSTATARRRQKFGSGSGLDVNPNPNLLCYHVTNLD